MEDSNRSTCRNGSEFTQEEKQLILYIYGSEGILATIICAGSLLMALKYRFYKDITQRLVLYQVLAGLALSVYNIMNMAFINYNQSTSSEALTVLCAIVGYIGSVTVMVKIIFTFWLTLVFFLCLICLKNPKSLRKLEVVFVITSVGLPVFLTWVPFIDNLYGISGVWCWIKHWKDECASEKLIIGVAAEYIFIYGPGTIIALINFTLLSVTLIVLLCRANCCSAEAPDNEPLMENVRSLSMKHRSLLKKILPLAIYPIVFIILFAIPLANRLHGSIAKHTDFPLFMMHAITEPFWGLFVGISASVHICVIKLEQQKKARSIEQAVTTKRPAIREDDVFTVDTVATTKTEFIVSEESST